MAVHKDAYQSSREHWVHDADQAVDGRYNSFSCTGTINAEMMEKDSLEGYHPWWAVDLGAEYNVTRVTATSAGDRGKCR